MDNPVENGNISLIASIVLGIISWFTPANIDLTLKVITGLGALVGIFFAVRYHWYATKTQKIDKMLKEEELKKLKKKDE